jgi:hypothetical protein
VLLASCIDHRAGIIRWSTIRRHQLIERWGSSAVQIGQPFGQQIRCRWGRRGESECRICDGRIDGLEKIRCRAAVIRRRQSEQPVCLRERGRFRAEAGQIRWTGRVQNGLCNERGTAGKRCSRRRKHGQRGNRSGRNSAHKISFLAELIGRIRSIASKNVYRFCPRQTPDQPESAGVME